MLEWSIKAYGIYRYPRFAPSCVVLHKAEVKAYRSGNTILRILAYSNSGMTIKDSIGYSQSSQKLLGNFSRHAVL